MRFKVWTTIDCENRQELDSNFENLLPTNIDDYTVEELAADNDTVAAGQNQNVSA